MSSCRLTKTLSLFYWNMRGVRNKFECDQVLNLLTNVDVLVVSETHFGIRSKSPKGFYLVVRSDPLHSVKPRGGVAIYKKYTAEIETRPFKMNLPDCCVISIVNTKILIIALYIPPWNSQYYSNSYFDNFKTVYESLSSTYEIIIVGDLNARISNRFPHRETSYKRNPDQTINQHGQQLISILSHCETMKVVNGAITSENGYDSEFTFFSGNRKSQNDWCLTNNLNIITDFQILPKCIYSDHCPCQVGISYDIWPSLGTIFDCSVGHKSHIHYDVNRKLPTTIKADRMNLVAFGETLEEKAEHILLRYSNIEPTLDNINILCNLITETIREVGMKCRIKDHNHLATPTQENCTSENFVAIAQAHQSEYRRLYSVDNERATYHRTQWLYYEEIALQKETEADLQEKKWREMYYKDPASLWKSIGWKETKKEDEVIPSHTIYNFFTDVFQSKKTAENPTLDEHSILEFGVVGGTNGLDGDDTSNGISSEDITMTELENGIIRLGSGTGLDGIDPGIMKVVPNKLKDCILLLYNIIYGNGYPQSWEKQLLFPSTKKGHTLKDPKLRGIAIGPVLGRLYDVIMDTRFNEWYQPNIHQSAYRKAQGSVLPLFSMFLLVDVAHRKQTSLYILLLDYEKAFDYTNRVEIARKLSVDKAGSRAIRNFIHSYSNTAYVAKISNNEVGPDISTKHGLTQGKTSSSSIFSYYISDMHRAIDGVLPKDCFDPLNLFQVADDSTPLADSKESLNRKAKAVFEYSAEKYVVINVPKTQFMKFSEHPDLTPLQISEETFVDAVNPDKGYCWLGFWLSYADNVPSLIKFNLKKKSFHICEFYGWLEINQQTPIILKLRVLYSCMFAAILYSCEAWGNIDGVAKQILLIERKALKRCLGVKDSVSNDIVYHELNIPDIIAKIMKLQQMFFAKIMAFEPEQAIIKQLVDRYSADEEYIQDQNSFLAHYLRLYADHNDGNIPPNNIIDNNIKERIDRLQVQDTTKITQYREVTNLEHNTILYQSFVNDELRKVITRWRLSCHKLRIETGRYTIPITPRDERLCKICPVVEDELHALFHCPAHIFIRLKFHSLLCQYNSVTLILNPQRSEDVIRIGLFIGEIEKNMIKLNMCN